MTRIPQMVSPKSPAEVLAQIGYKIMFKNNKKNQKTQTPTSNFMQ